MAAGSGESRPPRDPQTPRRRGAQGRSATYNDTGRGERGEVAGGRQVNRVPSAAQNGGAADNCSAAGNNRAETTSERARRDSARGERRAAAAKRGHAKLSADAAQDHDAADNSDAAGNSSTGHEMASGRRGRGRAKSGRRAAAAEGGHASPSLCDPAERSQAQLSDAAKNSIGMDASTLPPAQPHNMGNQPRITFRVCGYRLPDPTAPPRGNDRYLSCECGWLVQLNATGRAHARLHPRPGRSNHHAGEVGLHLAMSACTNFECTGRNDHRRERSRHRQKQVERREAIVAGRARLVYVVK